ncbi:MAG: hypothetical protein ABI181_01935 [Mycobacteriaceae bacterium]
MPRPTRAVLLVVSVVALAAGCTGGGGQTLTPESSSSPRTTPSAPAGPTTAADPSTPPGPAAQLRTPPELQVVGGDNPAAVAAEAVTALFVSAPVAVVLGSPARDQVSVAAATAKTMGAPVLLDGPVLAEQVSRLGAKTVLAIGEDPQLATRLPGVDVVTDVGRLPRTSRPTLLSQVTVLVRSDGTDDLAAVAASGVVAATAAAAGTTLIPAPSADPRAVADVVTALAAAPKGPVLAVGTSFGTPTQLSPRLRVARTGVQLPGGGQVMFPGRALVALYGHPGGPALGVLGEQGPEASVARAKQVAAPYDSLYGVPVVPTFEIIATVASSSAGADGNYSNEFGVEDLKPTVDAATRAGMYVVLDLQPGRADPLEQAKAYTSLLMQPNVGLALDPEWALGPGQLPVQQIGSLPASKINEVTRWLGDLTAKANLPQKVLVLHQFRLSMIGNESQLDTGNDQVAVLIHADGQGGRGQKEATWNAIVRAAPPGVFFGWKNFYDEDPQIASPADTVRRTPEPVMVSYQ